MPKKLNLFMLLFIIIAVVMTSAVRVTPVYADDGGTEPVTEESAAPPGGEETVTEAESAPQESAPAPENPQQAPEAAQPVAAADTAEVPAAESDAEESAAPPSGEEASADEETVLEEPVTVAEVLEQLPEETALVVVNEAGEVEPLATAEAAEIVATGDPMWCPVGATPGDATCTNPGPANANYDPTSFVSLLAYLAGNPAYFGSGVIWVEAAYDGNDNSSIILNGSALNNLSGAGNTLTIRGGWSGGNNTNVNPADTSVSDVSLTVTNWQGNLVIQNFDIVAAGDNSPFGLSIVTTGNVILDNVSVNDTPLVSGANGNGAIVSAGGDVSIVGSEFNNNAGNGLLVSSGGNIELNTVSANDNTLTGAYLDSSGAVNIAGGSQFNQNGSNTASHGLVVHAGGGITVNDAVANNNALRGASLTSSQNVTIGASTFSGNLHATGLFVLSGGSITLDDVFSFSNNMGAQLYTTGAGDITVRNSLFGMDSASAPRGNTATGLHAESGGAITLSQVISAYNGRNGGYLVAQGAINVTTSTFNSNAHGSYPEDPGLYAKSSGGDITLNHVYARENEFGAGVVLTTSGAGVINVVNNSIFNSNGTFGVQAQTEDGDITLDNVIASYNGVKGAYLGTYSGDIIIDNSTFVENGSYGIYAFTGEGNINLNLVTVLGSDGAVGPGADDLTDYGAILTSGGDVTVTNSTFELNTDVGLGIVSGGIVNLSNVIANQNGGHGVEVYSITTAGAICEGKTPVNIAVNVDGGTFTNNGGYGLMVKPGPGGTLTFVNPADFGIVGVNANDLGDYLLDLSQQYKDCTVPPEEPPCDDDNKDEDKDKGPLIVEVPATGGPTVAQDCDQYSATILKLPNGTWMKVGCPYEGFSHLEEILEENLPTPLGAGMNFLQGIDFRLTDGEGNLILNEDGTVTINFAIPEGSRARHHSILFWDETLNDGKGGWVELPPYEVGTSFALHPDDPEDNRTIISGVKQAGGFVTVTVNFPGVFILVEN